MAFLSTTTNEGRTIYFVHMAYLGIFPAQIGNKGESSGHVKYSDPNHVTLIKGFDLNSIRRT